MSPRAGVSRHQKPSCCNKSSVSFAARKVRTHAKVVHHRPEEMQSTVFLHTAETTRRNVSGL